MGTVTMAMINVNKFIELAAAARGIVGNVHSEIGWSRCWRR